MKNLFPTLNSAIQKVTETPKGFIFNGQYYSKDLMLPQPYLSIPSYGSTKDLSMFNGASFGYAGVYGRYYNRKVIDNKNPDISYVFNTSIYDANVSTTLKILEKDNKAEVLASSNAISSVLSNRFCVNTVLGQSDTAIYLAVSYATSTNTYFGYLDKATLSFTGTTNIVTLRYCSAKPLYEDANYIWFFARAYPQIMDIYKINKTTHFLEKTNSLTNRYKGTVQLIGYDAVTDNGNGQFEITYFAQDQATSLLTLDMVHVTLDFNEPIIVKEEKLLTCSTPPPIQSSAEFHHECFHFTDEDKKYLVRLYYQFGNDADTVDAVFVPLSGLYLYEITADTIEQKQFLKLATNLPRCILNIDNTNKKFIVGTKTSCLFVNWNANSKTFEVTDVRNNNPASIGISENGIVFVNTNDGTVETINPLSATNLIIEPDQTNFKFEGEAFDTQVKVKSLGSDGTQVSGTFKLVLIGNGSAIFKENSSNLIEITTSETDDIIVPITIINDGNFSIRYTL